LGRGVVHLQRTKDRPKRGGKLIWERGTKEPPRRRSAGGMERGKIKNLPHFYKSKMEGRGRGGAVYPFKTGGGGL